MKTAREAMSRIKKLSVSGYRGITKEVNLLLEGKSLILFGENRTGKSSFVEAIEKLLTGKVSSLNGRAKGLSSAKHGPSINVPRSGPEIDITFDDDSIFNLDASLESLPTPIKNYLVAAKQPLFILRRAQILQLVEEEPRERGFLLQPFLPLSEWIEIEDTFKQSKEKAERKAFESKKELNRVVNELSTLLRLSLTPVTVTEEALIESINKRLSKDSFPTINDAQEIQEGLNQVEQKLYSLGDISAHIMFHDLTELIVKIIPKLQIDWLAALLKEISELKDQEQTQAGLFFEEVLQKGLEWIEQAKLDHCPLCEKSIDRSTIAERIRHRLSEVEKLIIARRNSDKAKREAISNLKYLAQDLSAIEKKASSIRKTDIVNLIKEFGTWLDKTFEILLPQVKDIKIQQLREVFKSWPSYKFPVRFSEIQHQLKSTLSTIPAQETIQSLIDIKDFLSRAQRLWQEQESSKAQNDRAQRICEIATHVFEHAEQSRKEEIQSIFDKIAGDIDKLYAIVSQDKNRGEMKLEIRPEVGRFSVNIKAKFYDHEGDPRAYYNEADLDILGLCTFLALRRWYRNQYPEFNLLILDDVLTSIDAEHRVRFTELLIKEFKDYQIFLTTHDRIWFEYLRDIHARAGVSKQFLFKVIHKWNIDEGPDLREPQEELEELQQIIERGESSQIAISAGRFLEHILQEIRYNLSLAVQAKRSERYDIGELWPVFYNKIKKEFTGFYNKAQSSLDALDIRWPIRNWIGAHFNDWAKGVTCKESEDFGRAVTTLFDLSFCGKCRRYIQPSITPEGQIACRCGRLIYPPFDKKAKPSKDIEDILKNTLGALSDSCLTSDQYLKWKRSEIGDEN